MPGSIENGSSGVSADSTPGASTGLVATVINMFAAPQEAFTTLKSKPSILFPLCLIVLLNALVLGWYFSIVDYEWFIDDILAAENMDDTDRAQARESMLGLSINSFAMLGVLGGTAAIVVVNLIQAAYLSLAAAIRGDRFKFRHWFSLTCWAGMPVLLTIAGSAVTILLTPNGQLSAYQLDPLTLYNLGITTANASAQSLFQSISLAMLWSIGLLVCGHHYWTEASWGKSAALVLSPYFLVLGIWGFFAFG
ncbi:MAG: YIP1 family protein [Pseudohongiellaceae bacterium]